MSASIRDLEHTAQVQFVRAQRAEQKAEDIHHALNLMLNLGFERFHTALTMDAAVHEFELGTVRNLPAPHEIAVHAGSEDLTDRELPVLRAIAKGCSNKIIGSDLGISEHTIKNHVQSILGKLGASDRTHAVTIALQRGFIDL